MPHDRKRRAQPPKARSHQQDSYPSNWSELRTAVFGRDRTCQGVGPHFGKLECHHKTHVIDGGTHVLENLTALCDGCHSRLHGWRDTRAITTRVGKRPEVVPRPKCSNCKQERPVRSARLLIRDRVVFLCADCRRKLAGQIDWMG